MLTRRDRFAAKQVKAVWCRWGCLLALAFPMGCVAPGQTPSSACSAKAAACASAAIDSSGGADQTTSGGSGGPADGEVGRGGALAGRSGEETNLDRVCASADPAALAPHCNKNYFPCVPDGDDADCSKDADGPIYVDGPVCVLGEDVFQLDRDDDKIGCE